MDQNAGAGGACFEGVCIFSSLDARQRMALMQACSVVRFPQGATVFAQGDEDGKGVAFVLEGRLDVKGYAPNGKEVYFTWVGPNNFTGEVAALDGAPRAASVEAACDSLIAFMSPATFKSVMASNPAVAVAVMGRMAQSIRTSTARLLDVTTLASDGRVYGELLRMAERGAPQKPKGVLITTMPDQYEMSRRLGVTRETVSRAMSKLVRRGVCGPRRGGSLLVHDLEALAVLRDAEG